MVFCVSIIGVVLACAGTGFLAEKRGWTVKHLIWFVPSMLLVLALVFPEHLVALRGKELSTAQGVQAAEVQSEEARTEAMLKWIDDDAEYYNSVFSIKNLRKMSREVGGSGEIEDWRRFERLFKERYSETGPAEKKSKVARVVDAISRPGSPGLLAYVDEALFSSWSLSYYWQGYRCNSYEDLVAVLKSVFPAIYPKELPVNILKNDLNKTNPEFCRLTIEKKPQ